MSFLGSLLKIIAIGAFFIATGPFGLSISGALATALRIGGVVIGYLGSLTDRPRLLTDRQSLTISTRLEPGTAVPVVYGRGKVGGIVADWFIDPGSNKLFLYYIVALAHGSRDGLGIGAVESLWLDQRKAQDYVSVAIASSSGSNPATVTTTLPHGFTQFDYVTISGHSTAINTSLGRVESVPTSTTFTIAGIGGGTGGAVTLRFIVPYTNADNRALGVYLGSTVQNVGGTSFSGIAAPSSITNSGWSATTATGKGIAALVIRLVNFDVSAASGDVGPLFHGPPTVQAVLLGNRIYDPRTDSWTPGGDNPALVIRDYLLSTIYGCGCGAGLINEASFGTAADYCDVLESHPVGTAVVITSSSVANPTVVTTATPHGWASGQLVRIAGHTGSTPTINGDRTATVTGASTFTVPVNVTVGGTGGTVTKLVQTKRFTCNGVLDTARPVSDNLQELLSSCRGNLVWEQGQFKLTIRSASAPSPTLTLDPSLIIGEWSFRNAGLEEKWNVVKASYVEPANGEFKIQEVQWPLVGTTNAYLATDGGFTNRLDLPLPFTNDQLIAQTIAQVTLNEARLGIGCQVRCSEAALAASVGDLVYVTHPTPGWTLKQFWVTAMQLMPDTTVSLALQEYDPTAYDLATSEDRRSFPATSHPSLFTVPSPGAVTITALTPAGILITWVSASYGLIDYYEVQAHNTGGDPYVTIAHVRETGGDLQATAPLARPGQTWQARVRVINMVGWPSAWVESSTFGIPEPPAVQGSGSLVYTGYAPTIDVSPTAPTLTGVSRSDVGGNLCTGTGPWIQTVGWTTTGANDTYFQIDIQVATDSAGTTYVSLVTGLTTASSSYDDNTALEVKQAGGSTVKTYYRKYRVRLMRKSDSSEISHSDTTQDTLVQQSANCPV